jgi:glycogen synthase
MEILAEESVAAGHQIKVVTETESGVDHDGNSEVIRSPSLQFYVHLLRWSDVCLYASVTLLPVMVVRWPFVISHQTVYDAPGNFCDSVQQ